ncbi:heparinase II/III domain-containing protein [Catenuloplanes japonicus]|uniref:heparinase II/III domain-containing protein n=1 Tax=Catenuloplanes japonicus TaxID=33876 RepID=UPI00068DEAFB|nr:heparinase II/III family protein [Catenuloplanes japonicus]
MRTPVLSTAFRAGRLAPRATVDHAAFAAIPAATRDAVVTVADGTLGLPWPQPTLTRWRAYRRDGSRTAWEDPYLARRHRLHAVALALAVTGDRDRYADELLDGVWLLAEETTWCLPAHEHPDRTVPDPARPHLDLFAAETAATLAWILRLHEELFADVPGVAARISREIRRRVLDPYRADAGTYFWFGAPMNWNPWITDNVIAAALLTDPDPEPILELAVRSLDAYLDGVPGDGGCPEGISYWWHSGARLFEALELLGVPPEIWSDPLIRRIGRFPLTAHVGGEWSASFGDGNARVPRGSGKDHLSPALLHRYGRAIEDPSVAAFARASRGDDPLVTLPSPMGRAIAALTDTAWRDAGPAEFPAPPVQWLAETQVASLRGGALHLIAKAGHNDEPHNHNDVGSFVLAAHGEPIVVDAGTGVYDRDSFGPDRYRAWFTRSAFHSVPEIDGVEQGAGAEFRARDVRLDGADFTMDLAGAYPVAGLVSLHRTFTVTPGAITLTDAWQLGHDPATIRLRLLLRDIPHPVRIALPSHVRPTTSTIPLTDPLLHAVWGDHLLLLTLDVVSPGRTGAVTVRFEEAGRGDARR